MKTLLQNKTGSPDGWFFKNICAIFQALFAATLILTLGSPLAAKAQFGTADYGNGLTITSYTGPGGVVTIPSMINGSTVTQIGDSAFSSSQITDINIPDTVTNIGMFAFAYCGMLTNIVLPEDLIGIGDGAFTQCGSLTNIVLPSRLLEMGIFTFGYCSNLASIAIPSGITNIGEATFEGCPNLTNVVFSTNVVLIGTFAFAGCNGFTNFMIPNGVVEIDQYAFEACTNLVNITIPNTVNTIGEYAFGACFSLASVTIPASVTNIQNDPFGACFDLTAINVDPANSAYTSIDGVLFNKNQTMLLQFPTGSPDMNYETPATTTCIASNAFDSYNLTNVTISADVSNINTPAFPRCISLLNINVNDDNPDFTSMNGVLFNKNKTALVEFPDGSFVSHYNIPNTVTTISNSAFYQCDLSSVVIPNSVDNIPCGAFQLSLYLTNVNIPNTITNIGGSAFSGCALGSLIIPASVNHIGEYAFWGCENLKTVYFLGNAPTLTNTWDYDQFGYAPATAYYLPETSGWSTFAAETELPVVELTAPAQIANNTANASADGSSFGFSIVGDLDQSVLIQASTNLVDWQTIQTIMLDTGIATFSDTQWKNFPARYYRVR